jgi:Na+:H+ antiporter, NhaA family
VAIALVAGTFIGVAGASWLAVRLKLGELPTGVTMRHVVGAAAVAGIGFTVSLFIAGLAFPDTPELEDAAKAGILGASVVAALVGSVILGTRRT